MIVTCPNCSTRFVVPDTAIGPTGRRVRCGQCAYVWLAVPESNRPAPTPYPEENDSGKAASADNQEHSPMASPVAPSATRTPDSEAPFGTANLPAVIDRRRPWVWWGWILLGAFVLALTAGLLLGRDYIMQTFPQTQPLYERIGLPRTGPAAPAPPPFRIGGLTSSTATNANGVALLTVAGTVTNQASTAGPVPMLTVRIFDGDGAVLQTWRFDSGIGRLGPGQSAEFEQVFRDPPSGGERLSVTPVAAEP